MRKVLQPDYFEKFNCIGAACEDSCCIGWKVELDKKTYNKYKKIQDAELKPIIKEYVSRYHNDKINASSYGRIKMKKNGRCPFLNDKNLCKIYINVGPEYLSNVCSFYPRTVNKVNGILERSASTSCPEICRLALLDPEGMKFTQVSEDESVPYMLHRNIDTEGHLYVNKMERYFWDIRLLSLNILQNRAYSLDDRLVLLGIAYKQLLSLEVVKDIPRAVETLSQSIDSGRMKADLDKIPQNTQIQMRLAKEMTDMKVVQNVTSKRYIQCLAESLKGISFEKGTKIDEVTRLYDYNYDNYLKPYLEEKEYILENYLVNYFFKELMPFGHFENIWSAYTFLCINYSIVKMHLIGMSGYYKGIDDDMVIKLLQSFSKVVLHNRPFINHIIDVIEKNGYGSLPYLSILVKN